MRKTFVATLALASVGLAGCVAVPAYDPGPRVYAPPPAVVVAPSVGYYRGPRYYGGPRYYHRWHRYP
jgi:hypothetical protein